MGINVLSLFDGISCGQLALQRAKIPVEKYFASEIKGCAIKVTQEHFPKTIQIGDVTKIKYKDGILRTEKGKFNVGTIDLLIGGSPCQDFSIAGYFKHDKDKYGLKGEKSSLFFEYLRLLWEIQPKYFLLENVKMKKQSKQELDDFLGVKSILINSSLVSYQKREREYWSNIPNITRPKDRKISFQDYKCTDEWQLVEAKLNKTPSREKMWNNGRNGHYACKNITHSEKINCLTRKQDRCPNSGLIKYEDFCRYLTRSEIEQAQTLPIGYCDSISYNQMQDVCGDGWTVDVIAHIFKGLKEK